MNNYFKSILLLFLILGSCNLKKKNSLAKIEIIETEFNFGKTTLNDTITHSFKIKNLTDTKLKINNLATSCGCTTTGTIDSIANKNETIEIKVQFIPKKEQLDKEVSNSVVVEMNTEPPFIILKLKGNVN